MSEKRREGEKKNNNTWVNIYAITTWISNGKQKKFIIDRSKTLYESIKNITFESADIV